MPIHFAVLCEATMPAKQCAFSPDCFYPVPDGALLCDIHQLEVAMNERYFEPPLDLDDEEREREYELRVD